MSEKPPRIALVHALELSMAPINAAFDRLWPEAVRMNLLDDSLSRDLAAAGTLDDAMIERFIRLGRYAWQEGGADCLLFTCSAFGAAIDAVAAELPVPVFKPNSAMIDQAVAAANGRPIALLASFAPTLASMPPEFPAGTDLRPIHVAGALAAAQAGRGDEHDTLVAQAAAQSVADGCGVIALAQFSLARARALVADRVPGVAVLVTPDCAVEAVRKRLGG
ncbi:hypothetical protein FHW96_005090 [Novosphingobium sp. SG751A]|uniref:arylsulfatase n=1 Tax=Novosphingobium sp. SG751A TaxID=2587000 RepID=UPI00155691AC|nr:arylsulfatase [Novosphingobium sp. SG751A]NOW48900.1 hypothetical protein [Novosphingobium sp. SG751A]